nr:hypothetical protein BaRGS_003609 [Batillaria attramentaria]
MHFGSYPNFAVSSEASGYSFSMFAPPAFPLLDCLTPLEGAPFSTYDNDNDNTGSVNCAAKHGAGFWFQGTSCSAVCNPFGLLTWPAGDARTGVPYEVYWNHDTLGPITPRNMVAFLLNRP